MTNATLMEAACVSCGEDGRRRNMRTVNGTLTDECEGCTCPGWMVFGCFADTTKYGEPYIDLVFQRDTDVLRMDVTVSGQVHSPLQGHVATVSNQSITIAPNALVEFDIVSDYTFTNNFQMMESWHIVGHVVDRCPP